MRTTLAIDDDVLAAAKSLAERQHKSLGEVISDLARQALRPDTSAALVRNGVPLLPMRPEAKVVTPEMVKELLDDLP